MWPRQKVQSQNLSRRLSLEDHVRDSDPFYTRDAVNKLARYCIRCGSVSVCHAIILYRQLVRRYKLSAVTNTLTVCSTVRHTPAHLIRPVLLSSAQ